MKSITCIVGQHIRDLRCSHGMTTKTLAELLGVSQQQLSRYERGVNKIDVCVIFKIINIFGVPYESLFPQSSAEGHTQTKQLLTYMDPVVFNSGYTL